MNLFGIIGLKDIVDSLLVAGLMFYIYKLMKDTGTLNIFIGFLSFIIVWFLLAKVFDMQLIGAIMDKFTDAALFVIVVLFQDQIKRFFNEVGSHQRWRFLNKFLHKAENKDKQKWVMPVVYACMSMSKSKTGALIVIQQHMSLDDYARTGDVIDATINNRLLENIFFKNSPLHDGAVIIAGEKIEAAGCILPASPLGPGHLAGYRCHCRGRERGDGQHKLCLSGRDAPQAVEHRARAQPLGIDTSMIYPDII